ncbi:hypothetical protein FOA43_003039 [Brettanomyces nanus]|uniref:Endonuclease/exonuclease/phosphatase domain-containing protein n=1 Tax=Eeniella nana TaxID=13502 RepID=A0A875RPZ9_EENNA|nr:uncharacterized protein FOA43_003039 [Brettanomyces nanus]QPG75680.1 hypothetical protein FOA43_003039 [Brettanomyces nanus]
MTENTSNKHPEKISKKNKGGHNRPSPEEIGEIRRQRQEKKKLREKLIAEGRDVDDPSGKPLYIKREMLEVSHEKFLSIEKGLRLRFMTYNLLAQTLIRRSMFPDNGPILKWTNRSKPLFQEVKNYNCDIMCMQEMDYTNYDNFWKPKLSDLGYHSRFNRSGTKSHGVAIFYRDSLFTFIDICRIDYDSERTGAISPRTITQNVGLIVGLSLKSDPDKVILFGTTHLFWHPFGTYERTRQTYIALAKCREFQNRIRILHPKVNKIWKFFAGDFNSQPYDSPYLSITSKPVQYNSRCKTVISCSTSFQFSSLRGGGVAHEEEKGGNVEKYGENQPKDPVPDTFIPTADQLELVEEMQKLHNSLPVRAISMYSVGYKLVDPVNAGIDNDRNEPFFSNWAHTWRGLLDYIFLVKEWNGNDNCKDIDQLEQFETDNDLVLEKLLKMPHPKDMDKGLPRQHQYPSDHLCMIAQISLKLL